MKIKKFWEEHKVDIIVYGSFAVVTVGTLANLHKLCKIEAGSEAMPKPKVKWNVPEKLAGLGFGLVGNGKSYEIMTETRNVTIEELGTVGEALRDLPDVDENSSVWALISVKKELTE